MYHVFALRSGAMMLLCAILCCFQALAQTRLQIPLFSPLSTSKSAIYQRLPELKEYEQDCALMSVQNGALATVREQKPDVFFTSLPLPNDSTVTLRLVRREALAFDTKPTITTEQGTAPIKQTLLPVLYAGKVLGDEESIASLCFTSEEVFGIITLHGQTYNIGRVRQPDGGAQTEVYTVSNDRAIPHNAQLPQCAVSEHDIMQQSKEILSTLADISNGKKSASLQSDKRLRVEVAVEVDYAMYQQFNNSVERASAYATSLIATVSQIFERDLNVELSISYLNVWTSQDPFVGSNTSAVLNTFSNYWRNNRKEVKRNTAHLLSVRSLNGGRGDLNNLCGGFAVSGDLKVLSGIIPLPTYSYETKIIVECVNCFV